jgi:hypothetical protein
MRRLVPLFVLLAFACLPVAGASADPFPVTTTADNGAGSLRAAIAAANGHSGADSIPIEVTGHIELASALPPITDDVTIAGPSTSSLSVERASATPFRIFLFSDADATLSNLTVSGGEDTVGGGILNSGGSLTLVRVAVTGNEVLVGGSGTALATGGGIFSSAPLTLRESLVRGNRAVAHGTSESVASGGGVEATSAVTVERSTISENSAQALAEGGNRAIAEGGGMWLENAPVTIEESTISGNAILASEGAAETVARGAGIRTETATITGSTVAGNQALISTGATISFVSGANLQASSAVVRDSIVADPLGAAESCFGGITSGGYNLDEDGSCGFHASGDLVGVVAGLEPLADNGGPTPTQALRADSPAVDRGNSFGSSADQRGLPRPSDFPAISNAEGGNGSDIGAFELQAPPPSPGVGGTVLVTTVATDRQPPDTRIVKGPARDSYEREAKFRFASTEAQSSFQCKVDKSRWRGCRNPYKRTVKPGKHVFKARAIDRFGNVDPTPARFGWRVKPLG